MAITVDGSGITFSSGSQTEAVTTTWGGVGSYMPAYLDTSTTVARGSTLAGSALFYANNGYAFNVSTVGASYYMLVTQAGSITKTTLGLSGTWRVMTGLQLSNTSTQLLVRIS